MNGLKRDPVTVNRLAFVYPGIAESFNAVDREMWDLYQLRLRCVDGIRTSQSQDIIWAKGRSQLPDGRWAIVDRKSVLTFARPGYSLHQYGLAFDFCFWGDDPYLKKVAKADFYFAQAANLLVKTGMESGKFWAPPKTDVGHAQNLYGMNIEQIRFLAQKGGNRMVWSEIDKKRSRMTTNQGEFNV